MPTPRNHYLILWILGAATVQAGLPTTNTTAVHADTVTCVYPLSGQYGFLPRILYYITLVFAILARSQEWLVVGALASALTYSGCAAIHMIALSSSRRPVFDLDILGCWAILSTGCMAFVAMIHWSSTVNKSKAKIILILWGILLGAGLACGRSVLFDDALQPEPACRARTGQLLTQPYQRLDPIFNCTYECFKAQEIMREKNEQMVVPSYLLNTGYAAYGILLVGPIMASAYKAMSFDFHAHSPSEACRQFVTARLLKMKSQHQPLTDHIYDTAVSRWYGGYFILIWYMHRQPWSWHHLWVCAIVYPWLALELFLDALTPPVFVANIVLNELNIQAQNLPTNELPYAVGQWSPMVSTLLVIMASAVCRGLEVWDNRKKVDIPREEGPTHNPEVLETTVTGKTALDDPRVLEEGGQMTGVVVPRLEHAETLRDMESILKAGRKK